MSPSSHISHKNIRQNDPIKAFPSNQESARRAAITFSLSLLVYKNIIIPFHHPESSKPKEWKKIKQKKCKEKEREGDELKKNQINLEKKKRQKHPKNNVNGVSRWMMSCDREIFNWLTNFYDIFVNFIISNKIVNDPSH